MNSSSARLVSQPPSFFSSQVLWWLLFLFLPAAFLIGGVGWTLYYQELTNEDALAEQSGKHRVDLCIDIIHRELKSVESDLLYLSDQAALHNFLSGREDSRLELQDEYVLFCRRRGVYDQIRFLDSTGRERIRVNSNNGRPAFISENELQAKAEHCYFAQTMLLDRGQVFVSPFDLNVEYGEVERPLKPTIRFATPVYDRQGAERGILILNYLGAGLIEKLTELSPANRREVWLLNREGFYLSGPNPDDEWGFMFGHDRTFASQFPAEWQRLVSDENSQFRTQHGLFTVRALSPKEVDAPGEHGNTSSRDAQLIVVAHTAPEVLEVRTARLFRGLLLLFAVLLFVLFFLTWYLAYIAALREVHQQELAATAARLRDLSARLFTAQEDERRRVSRDLHDELGQLVTSITLDLQRAAQSNESTRRDEWIARVYKVPVSFWSTSMNFPLAYDRLSSTIWG